jgi:enoyl-CoA hydratase/carnithine racemase
MAGKINVSEIKTNSGHIVGVLEIENKGSLNALTLNMLQTMKNQLELWQNNDDIVCVLMEAVGEKAFCAGGDVKAMFNAMANDPTLNPQANPENRTAQNMLTEYFTVEYDCDNLIHIYKKPIIVWGEGIVMGGGIGVYIGASHRVITPHSRLAMPEISIGLYPDVGGTYFLNQLPEGIGLFLALTGALVNSTDALDLEIADFILLPENHDELLESLKSTLWGENDENHKRITEILDTFAKPALSQHPVSQLTPHKKKIEEVCKNYDLNIICEQILAMDKTDRWIQKAKATLVAGSPISAHICFKQVQDFKTTSLADCFRMELSLSVKCGLLGEFQEGIRARLIDKDKPNWIFPTIESVDPKIIDNLFVPIWSETQNPLAHLK